MTDPRRQAMLAGITRAYPASSCVVTDPQGRVLLVQNFNRFSWGCPGGVVDPGETPQQAAQRELAEETGLHLPTGRLLLTAWISGHGQDLEHMPGVQFYLDMGTAPAEVPLRLQPDEVKDAAWVHPDRINAYMGRLRAERLRAALTARTTGAVQLLTCTRDEIIADDAEFGRAQGAIW